MASVASTLRSLVSEMKRIGFRKRAGIDIYTIELADSIIGWVGMNRASSGGSAGELELWPIIGLRHQEVEQIVSELKGKEPNDFHPATVFWPLRYIMPEELRQHWWFTPENAPEMARVVADAIEKWGLPWMREHASLAKICELAEDAFGEDSALGYTRPVLWQLLGNPERVTTVINEVNASVSYSEPYAVNFRRFVKAFKRRFS
jgi:hypothetical protein